MIFGEVFFLTVFLDQHWNDLFQIATILLFCNKTAFYDFNTRMQTQNTTAKCRCITDPSTCPKIFQIFWEKTHSGPLDKLMCGINRLL